MNALPVSIAEDRQRQRAVADPLIDDNPMRFVTLPIHFHRVWGAYKAHEAHFWTAEDVDVSAIHEEVGKLEPWLRTAMVELLTNDACTIFGDDENPENHAGLPEFKLDKCAATMALTSDLQIPEGRSFYGFQASYENILLELQSIALHHYFEEDEARTAEALLEMSTREASIRRAALWHRHVWEENELGLTETPPSFAERVFANGVLKQVNTLGHRILLAHIKQDYPELIGAAVGKILMHTIETAERHLAFNAMISKSLVEPMGKAASEELLKMAVSTEDAFLKTVFKDGPAGLLSESLLRNESLAVGACFHLGGATSDVRTTLGDSLAVVHPVLASEADEMVKNDEDTKQNEKKDDDELAKGFTVDDDSDF